MRLYIPIWYNSSTSEPMSLSAPIIFTFQSGTIQASKQEWYGQEEEKLYIPIWYNSSRIGTDSGDTEACLYIPIWYNSSQLEVPIIATPSSFTFQSGTIQAVERHWSNGYLCSFTFQSGTIQAGHHATSSPADYNFTFQSGTIQARRTAESCFQCFQLQFLSTMII